MRRSSLNFKIQSFPIFDKKEIEKTNVAKIYQVTENELRRESLSKFILYSYQGCLVFMLNVVALGNETGKTMFASFMMIFL